MRKDITIEKIIDRRLNPDKYKKERINRIYTSKLKSFKTIIDEKQKVIISLQPENISF